MTFTFGQDAAEFDKLNGFIPWVGSKRKLLPLIRPYVPKKINRYFEPFCGGLSTVIDIMSLHAINPEKCFFNDLNPYLINFYNRFTNKSSYDSMLDEILKIMDEFNGSSDKKKFFNIKRDEFNLALDVHDERQAVLFFFLLTEAFQHMWRVNQKGEFNETFRDDGPMTVNKTTFEFVRKLIKDVDFVSMDFREFLELHYPNVEKGDFVYFDPPYDDSVTSYERNSFGEKEQEALAGYFKKYVEKGCNCLLSNSLTPRIEKLYKDFRIIPLTRNNTWQRVANNKEKKVVECLIVGGNV